MMKLIPLAVVALSGLFGDANAQPDENCANVKNPGFEDHAFDNPVDQYEYVKPVTGWTIAGGGYVQIRQGSSAWGGSFSGFGNYYLGLQTKNAVMQQRLTVEKNTNYNISFWVAERSNDNAAFEEKVQVSVNGKSILTYSSNEKFTLASVAYDSGDSESAMLKIQNAGDGGDQTIFIDQIRVCKIPPVTETTVTETSTTTVMYTTHTINQQVAKANQDIVGLENELVKQNNDLKRQLATLETRLSQLETTVADVPTAIDTATSKVGARVNALAAAVTAAVRGLPRPSAPKPPGQSSCNGDQCVPTLEATSNDLSLKALGGNVLIATDTCGEIDLCGIARALDSLKNLNA